MLLQLVGRKIDDLVRNMWSPRVGDRVQFIRAPGGGFPTPIEIGNCYTIVNITIHNAGYSTEVVLLGDDGVENKVDFFRKSDVRLVTLSFTRKALA